MNNLPARGAAPALAVTCAATVVVIPAYNEAGSIREVVMTAMRHAGAAVIVVVDDGSSDATAACLDGLPVTLLRNQRNLGKAASLWRGFELALQMQASRVVTLDGDGQHRPEDMDRLLQAAERMPSAIVIGARLHQREQFPPARYWANRLARFLVSWAAGYYIADSQSGFRVYPAALLRQLRREDVPGEGFVFESEILIAAARRGVRSIAVDIPAIYHHAARPSHFHPVRDILGIGCMLARHLLRRGLYPAGLWRALRRAGPPQ